MDDDARLPPASTIVRKEAGVGWIILSNPRKRNAITPEMWSGFSEALSDFQADESLRAVVLRGAGEEAFTSGADISALRKRAATDVPRRHSLVVAREEMMALRLPLIVMIHGYCLGGGMGVAMSADIRIASEKARFGIPAARIGAAYPFECLEDLASLVGPSRAKDIIFSGRELDAQEALRIGLIDQVAPPEELEAAVSRYAARIAENAPLSVRAGKVSIAQAVKDAASRDMAAVTAAIDACQASADFAEGMAAFSEKRKPVFKGR